jgi:hypothetical protein
LTTEKKKTSTEIALTDRRAFAPSEMIECSGCARANPPTRSNCLYCGAPLETVHVNRFEQLALAVPKSELAQGSLSHVAVTTVDISETALAGLAGVCNLTTEELAVLVSAAGRSVPVCAVDSSQAENICQRLRGMNFEPFTDPDEQLNLEVAPKDLRTLEFTDESLVGVCRRGGEHVTINRDDVILIVAGRLFVTTLEIEKKKSGGQTRTFNEREFSADEAVLDMYARNVLLGWRIKSGSFDFSFLGDEKSITAFTNFSSLTNILRRRACNADFDDAYNRLRSILAKMWPSEPTEGKTERRRAGARRIQAIVASKDNLGEFTRYSRLRRFLKARELADKV